MSVDTDDTTTVAVFKCQLGFSLNGGEVLACQVDGTWNGTEPTCGNIFCRRCSVEPLVTASLL